MFGLEKFDFLIFFDEINVDELRSQEFLFVIV